nr:uncharacterized protein LOC124490673 [Dermatophagoides farinae]
MSIIKAWIELRSFASKHVNNTKPISIYKQLQLYPYKPVYGLPDNDCQQPAFRAEFDRCEEEQRKRWRITVDDYYMSTSDFCCFVWSQLKCELYIVERCTKKKSHYGNNLMNATKKMFGDFCKPIKYDDIYCFATKQTWILALAAIVILAIVAYLTPMGPITLFCTGLFFYNIGAQYYNTFFNEKYWEPHPDSDGLIFEMINVGKKIIYPEQ